MIIRLIINRVAFSILTLFFVSILIFTAVEILPGDVASRMLGRAATDERLSVLRAKIGLDVPPVKRYISWIGNVIRGDFGVSMANQRPIKDVLLPKLKNTLILSIVAFLLYIPFAVLPAILQALKRGKTTDHLFTGLTFILLSTPDFLLATFFLVFFVVLIPLFPATSLVTEDTSLVGWFRALFMPSLVLSLAMAVYAIRLLRDNLIEVLEADFVRMAELKGLNSHQVLWRHALPNALIPTLNVTALNVAYLLGGVVIVEKVFTYPGFGSLMVDALQLRDATMTEATVLIASIIYIGSNLFADIGSIILNPRLRRT